MSFTRTARLRAFAKLNLGLRVLYKRTDGYHELRTVFQTVSLHDGIDVSFIPARATRITIEGTPDIADNLVGKAAIQIMETMKIHGDVRFVLKKNIPMGAGLGGGSSNAAAALLALPALTGKKLSDDDRFRIAAGLGSDVPFFLHGGTALGLGRGEELYPLPELPRQLGLIIAPRVHSSTAEAYRRLSETLTTIPLQNKLASFQQEIWQRGEAVGMNDFEGVVFAQHPELAGLASRLRRLGASPVLMTGSGSAIFGLFQRSDSAKREKARAFFASKNERVYPISFVSRARYRSVWRNALAHYISQDPDQWPPQSPSAR
jgi:4-diphosphocytidyl-2-C-methyl-D-erythritol kinase